MRNQTSTHRPESLHRFLEAQAPVWDAVIEELRNGRKKSHWMWFVFPQIAGLGTSRMSHRYAIASKAEANVYARHPVLGLRLLQCFELVLSHPDKTAEAIFGPIDAKKFQSCATLFRACEVQVPVFDEVLACFYKGEPDQVTLSLLER